MNTRVAVLTWKHFHNHLSQAIWERTGICLARPVRIYGWLNTRCNARCDMCECWSQVDKTELAPTVWIQALLSLKELTGSYFINFSGGEPFLYKGLWEILATCREHGILAGVTTNGFFLNESNTELLADFHPFNCNISVDGATQDTHDRLRGLPGLFDRIMAGVENLHMANAARGTNMRIIWNTVVNSINLAEIPDLIRLAAEKRVTAIQLVPLNEWSEACRELWITDVDTLRKVVKEVISLKQTGYPVMTSESAIRLWVDHFLKKPIPRNSRIYCQVHLTNFEISQNGDVYLCPQFPPIGNIQHQTARAIWNSREANHTRNLIQKCTKLCLVSCRVHRGLKDKVELFRRLVIR